MQNKTQSLPLTAAIAAVVLLTQANAVQAGPNTLTPGGPAISPVAGGPGPGAGATLLYSTNFAWSPSAVYVGSLTADVWTSDANNPYSGLTFTYELTLGTSSTDGIGQLSIGGYAGFNNIDVTYESSSIGFIPDSAVRSGVFNNGNDLNFSFANSGEIPPGTNTVVLVVDTGRPPGVTQRPPSQMRFPPLPIYPP